MPEPGCVVRFDEHAAAELDGLARDGVGVVDPEIDAPVRRRLGGGVVTRRTLPPPAASRVYELTDWGRQLEPVVLGLGRWGSQAPFPSGDGAFSADSAVLGLKTMFSSEAAADLDATYELRLGEQRFRAQVTGRRFSVSRGGAERPDATIETDPATLAELVWHGLRLPQAVRSGRASVDGSRSDAERFLRLFPAAS